MVSYTYNNALQINIYVNTSKDYLVKKAIIKANQDKVIKMVFFVSVLVNWQNKKPINHVPDSSTCNTHEILKNIFFCSGHLKDTVK